MSRDLRELKERQFAIDNPELVKSEQVVRETETTEIASGQNEQVIAAPDTQEMAEHAESIAKEPTDAGLAPFAPGAQPEIKLESPALPPTFESLQSAIMESAQDSKTTGAEVVVDALNLDVVSPQNDDEKPGPGISTTAEEESKASPATAAPESHEAQAMNFDSLFDVGESAGNAELNFDDLDFSADAGSAQPLDFSDSNGDLDLSSFGDHVNTNNDDINAMFQGLENFGDTSDPQPPQQQQQSHDFTMADLLPSNPTTNNDQSLTTPTTHNNENNNTAATSTTDAALPDDYGMSGGDLDMALGVANNESMFDDLLDGIDFSDGADDNNSLGGNMMEHGEFEDAYFGLGGSGDAQ